MRRRWLRPAAVPLTLAFMVAAACSTSDNNSSDTTAASGGSAGTAASSGSASAGSAAAGSADLAGTEVTVFGSEDSENEAGAMQDALTEFGEANGIDDHLRRRARLRAADQHPGARRQPARHRHLPAARQAAPVRPSGDVLPICPTTSLATAKEDWADSYLAFCRRRRHPVRRAVQVRPQVARLVQPGALEEKGYEVPETLTDFKALTGQDDRQRRHAAVRRHRVRPGHRLAVHRLGRGADPARAGHRLLQPVGRPRGAVQRPAGGRRSTRSPARPVDQARAWCSPPVARSPPRRSATTPSRSSRASA